jgi:UDP-N-acetyl-D-glucosamine dehydrogenase
VPITAESLAGYDAVVISTAHSAYDWDVIGRSARLIVDTRNALKGWRGDRSHIVMA